MSSTELHIGKIKKVDNPKNLSAQDLFLEVENIDLVPDEYSDVEDFLYSEYNEKYLIYKDTLYKLDDKYFAEGDYIEFSKKNVDGSVDYILEFYNGGTCLNEMLEDVINAHNLKEEK